jgi:ganglioside-induced differentiation-associated protein 1
MLYLYHGTTSVCAIKARLALHEKGLEWDGELLDLHRGDQHRPEYLKLNPNGVVPTLVHDGRVIIESTLIIEYLDEVFRDPPLMPADPYQRAQARLWMKKIDDYLHATCSAVTFAIAFRQGLLKKTPEELEARFKNTPDPAYRERQLLSVMHGIAAPHVAPAVKNYDKYVGEMEVALRRTPYLVGEAYSLADLAATSYVNRAEMLAMDGLWSSRPHVADWLRRIRERPSYDLAITEYLTEADKDRFDIPREETAQKVREILRAN